MRVNEDNFVTGNEEDVEPSYVDVVVDNHNQDEDSHPDIRELICDTVAFYQAAKDEVAGVAEAAQQSAGSASASSAAAEASSDIAQASATSAQEARSLAEGASLAAQAAVDVVKQVHPQICDGEWYVYSEEDNALVPSGIVAEGRTPVRGVDYWTADDIAEIKTYVDEAILGGEW